MLQGQNLSYIYFRNYVSILNIRHLTFKLLASLTEECPNLRWVRYLENWKANSRDDLFQFWNYISENNIDLDCGETEWTEVSFIYFFRIRSHFNWQELERRNERNDLSKKKMNSTFCSTDILSKMFGLSYQEGEGHAAGNNHILANPFPQERENHPQFKY